MKSPQDMEEEGVPVFNLQFGTDSFVSRSRDVFAGLGALEDKHSAFLKATESSRDQDHAGLIKGDPEDEEDCSGGSYRERDRSNDKAMRMAHNSLKLSKTRESDYESRPHFLVAAKEDKFEEKMARDEFRRPPHASRRMGRQPVPNFKKHPEKYKCYSLADVSSKDISEKANQQAALIFLEERRLEREKQERKLAGLSEDESKFDASTAACSQGKIAFSHPRSRKMSVDPEVTDKSTSKDFTDKFSEVTDVSIDTENRANDCDVVDTVVDQGNKGSESFSRTFKMRKNVKRHIRRKDSDGDSN